MGTPVALRILIVDQHEVVREGLRTLLGRQPDMTVVAEARDGLEAFDQFRRHRPDLMLTELRLPARSGVETTAEIRQIYPQARVVVFTALEGDEDVYRALKAGACSYVFKSASHAELLATLRAVAAGRRSLPPKVAERLAQHFERIELTRRELDVLQLIVAGKANKQIAGLLGVGEGTVKTHVNHILDKLGVAGRTQAATQAIRWGLVPPP